MAALVAEVVNATDPSLLIEPQQHQGQHRERAAAGGGQARHRAGAGRGRVRGAGAASGRAPANLKIVAAMYSTPGMFVVRADSSVSHDRRPQGQAGRVRAQPAPGSSSCRATCSTGSGSTRKRTSRRSISSAPATGPPWCWTAAPRRCGAAASAGPASPRWRTARAARASSRRARRRARASAPSTRSSRRSRFPAGAYRGIDAPLESVGSFSFILARPTLADDSAYRFARALHRGESALVGKLDQARETTAANTAAGAPRQDLIHPGVLRYLREIGVVR